MGSHDENARLIRVIATLLVVTAAAVLTVWWILDAEGDSADLGGGKDVAPIDPVDAEGESAGKAPDVVPRPTTDDGDGSSAPIVDPNDERWCASAVDVAAPEVLLAAVPVRTDASLGPPCDGADAEAVDTIRGWWGDLSAVAPVELTAGVRVVGVFAEPEGDTAAYAVPLEDDPADHLIAVELSSALADPEELRLTLTHELAHVFTQVDGEIDIAVPPSECDTFHNGFGCFADDAFVTRWVDAHWDPADLASLPKGGGIDEDGGGERCSLDPGFPGAYAASHPEEDFAESLAAFVHDVPVPDAVAARLALWEGEPLLVEFRAAVRERGDSVDRSSFDICG